MSIQEDGRTLLDKSLVALEQTIIKEDAKNAQYKLLTNAFSEDKVHAQQQEKLLSEFGSKDLLLF